jgi:hypothetical protein
MQVMPVDLTGLVAVVMGTLMFLIPIAGFTLRYAIKPVAEAMARLREGTNDREALALLERRMSLMEQEVHGLGGMRDELGRLLEELEFQRQLKAPERQP